MDRAAQANWIDPARTRAGATIAALEAALQGARGQLFPWAPVCLALGIGVWFALPWEPGLRAYTLAGAVGLAALAVRLWAAEVVAPLAIGVLCLCLGFLAAGVRAHSVAAPILGFRYYGPVEGRVVEVDRSQSDMPRLTLDRVVLEDMSPARTPARIRVSLHGDQVIDPQPGQRVMLTGHLSPPEGPVEPGGFDFQRMAFFAGLGAVGYTRSPALVAAPPEPGALWINRTRQWLSRGIRAAVPGDAGAFASGVMTGDRSGLSLPAVKALRDSSLAHLLAISGMNMVFLTSFVFVVIRRGVALVPPLALRMNSKKIAAGVGLAVAWFYLLLSGANVATERAFVMVAVMLGAILFDRRALSLRSVAIAAMVLLMAKPESLAEPGFQMSFAATIALIAGFAALEEWGMHRRLPRWVVPSVMVVASSAIAGVATAPYAAAHFNRLSDLGFFANLLTVPVMGLVVMPAGVIAALLAPVGLAGVPLWVMGKGAAWILYVAEQVAAIEGAVTPIVAPGIWVVPLISLGVIWAILTRGRLRLAGVAAVVAAFALWSQATRPALLISADGSLAGLMGPAGRALSSDKGAGFTATSWLENDGDLGGQAAAAARPGFDGPRGARRFAIGPWRGVMLSGKGAADRLGASCAEADLVILSVPPGSRASPEAGGKAAAPGQPVGKGQTPRRADGDGMIRVATPPGGCHVIDRDLLARTGPLAVDLTGGRLILTPTRHKARLWTGRDAPLAPITLTLRRDQ